MAYLVPSRPLQVTKFLWIKSGDKEDEIKKLLNKLSHEKGVKNFDEAKFSSNALSGLEEDISEVADELKEKFPEKVLLKNYPPFGDPPAKELELFVTLTFNFNDNILLNKKFHTRDSDLIQIAQDIHDKLTESQLLPTVHLIARYRPPHLHGDTRAIVSIGNPAKLTALPVVDVDVQVSQFTEKNISGGVRDILKEDWKDILFVNYVKVSMPSSPNGRNITVRVKEGREDEEEYNGYVEVDVNEEIDN